MHPTRVWLSAFGAAAIVLTLACKPKDPIPTKAPGPLKASEPQKVLEHFAYMSVRKDPKAAAVLSPADVPGLTPYASAWWFHRHAGEMGASLSAEEIQLFGLDKAKELGLIMPGISKKDYLDTRKKVDEKALPAMPDAMAQVDETKIDELPNDSADKANIRKWEYDIIAPAVPALLESGIYRIAKVIPAEAYPKLTVQAVKPDTMDKAITQVYYQYGEKLVLQVSLKPKKDGNLAVVNVQFKVGKAAFQKIAEAEGGK